MRRESNFRQPPVIELRSSAPAYLERPRQAGWRQRCGQLRTVACAARFDVDDPEVGPCRGMIECDHIRPKSQGGAYVVENGGFLCHRHHEMKTNSRLQWRFGWLGQDQVEWLAKVGWVAWGRTTGEPYGLGWRHFKPLRPSQLADAMARGRLPQLSR
jgi:hypothetical protein